MKFKFVTNDSKPHLGGNLDQIDPGCWCPSAWEYCVKKFNIKTVMDVGSGYGYAAKLFHDWGLDVTAIDGLPENIENSKYPAVLHDLTLGPYFKEIDFVNCIEVVEHIEEKFINNLLTTLTQGKFLLMTHAIPGQAGWHHVNCQESDYWINHLKSKNLELLEEETQIIRTLAEKDGAFHVSRNGMIFKKI